MIELQAMDGIGVLERQLCQHHSAAMTIKRRLHQLDVDVASHEDFLVDFQTRLVPGEQQRAVDWAMTLAQVPTSKM